ncbi:XisI protein [cf. Phormidesmis sp. LEGE 11477]|uniref:XisI protein n=1 Tax=cf. Phormidesmis sp. LEGE 11477 TaxID=1828680 RepID=UPI0018821C81|nr:XisI protein [cf. Phormidesmis sp. LEGE 11477]MBE9062390.1 XisI protein [cf. Phormidesmis sp. LEGE 11477]
MGPMNSDYREIIKKLLREYVDFLSQDETIQQELVFDHERDRYLLVETGWQNDKRIYGPFLHLDIKDGKVWIQHDGTEDGIAYELEAAGIPKDRIVLGYRSLERRKLTEYAVS